jgi:hypothetical protein
MKKLGLNAAFSAMRNRGSVDLAGEKAFTCTLAGKIVRNGPVSGLLHKKTPLRGYRNPPN